jgi:hypothetical protein
MGCLDRRERGFSFNGKKLTQGVSPMEDKEKKEVEEKSEQKKGEPLPYCTNAPSAEHSRGTSEEEPCDDAREGR